MHTELLGSIRVVRRGRRLFAAPREMTLSEKIHARNVLRTNWTRDDKCSGAARVIHNQR